MAEAQMKVTVEGTEPEIWIMSGLVVNPGDTLVLTLTDSHITVERMKELQKKIQDKLPGVEVVIISGVSSFKLQGGN